MKRLSFLSVSLLVCLVAAASPVTQDEARQRARQFMARRAPLTAAKSMTLATRQPQRQAPATQAATGAAPAYYVFNIGDADGFVIVSGDDLTPTILGYADSGHFDTADMPDNMREWLRGCEEQTQWLRAGRKETTATLPQPTLHPFYEPTQTAMLKPGATAQRKAPSVRHSVAPLLTTTWDQNDPYNRLLIDGSKHTDVCCTGCVATAMAQVLNYHGKLTGRPKTITADIAAYSTKTAHYSVLPVSKGTAIDWDGILDAYTYGTAATTDEERRQADAVAQLMHFSGAAVNTDYGTAASGADPTLMPTALIKHFGYDAATRNANREAYSISQWNDIVYNELAAQRPVLMSGQSSGGGHAFVVDGFDGDELFHINWGWGGHCNGYYRLAIANPTDKQGTGAGDSADGYSMYQFAVVGAQPDTGIPFKAEGLTMDFENIATNGATVTFGAYNQNEKTTAFDVGIGYFQDDGSIMPIKYYDTGSLPQHYGYKKLEFEVKLPKNDGTAYKVAVVCREAGTTEWLTPMNPSTYYIEAIGRQGSVTLTIVRPQVALNVEGIKFEAPLRAMRQNTANVTVTNAADEYYGSLNFSYRSADGTDTGSCPVGVTITEGQTQTVQFPFKPKNAGEYELKIEAEGAETAHTSKVEVGRGAPTSTNVNLGIDIRIANLNSKGNAILGNKAKMVVSVTNDTDTDYEGMFVMLLVKPGRFSYSLVTRHFEAHSSVVLEQESDVAQGEEYAPVCMTAIPGRQMVTQQPSMFYGVEPAVTIYMADGTHHAIEALPQVEIPDSAVAVDLTGNTVTKTVTPSSNANCLYYLSEETATPEGLNDNVVKGAQAERLTLADNALPFTPIASFNAGKATYTRSFDGGLKAEGTTLQHAWTTICLPFEAQACTLNDGTQVDWMKGDDGGRHNFWAMEFVGDEEGTLYFAPAERIQANMPYLLMVPGPGLKGLRDMTAAPVTFEASNAEIKAGAKAIAASSNFKFVGTTETVSDNDKAYEIATDGSICTRAVVKAQPFRAYMKAMSHANPKNNVPISINAVISAEPGENVPLKGDVNGDGAVDVADISAVITVMAGVATEGREKAADVNGDKSVDVADISAIITIMAN